MSESNLHNMNEFMPISLGIGLELERGDHLNPAANL